MQWLFLKCWFLEINISKDKQWRGVFHFFDFTSTGARVLAVNYSRAQSPDAPTKNDAHHAPKKRGAERWGRGAHFWRGASGYGVPGRPPPKNVTHGPTVLHPYGHKKRGKRKKEKKKKRRKRKKREKRGESGGGARFWVGCFLK